MANAKAAGLQYCPGGLTLKHYHNERPHQGEGIENELLIRTKQPGRPKTKRGEPRDEVVPLPEIRCKQRLGGLLKSYSRRAA